MNQSDSKLRTIIYKSIVVLMIFLFAIIFVGTITTAQTRVFHGILSPIRKNSFLILLTTIIGTGYILLFRYLNCMKKKELIIASIIMASVMVLIYVILLLCLDPFSSSDAYNVQDYALYLAKTGVHEITEDAPHATYFGWFPNNYFITILFSKYMKILLSLGVTDMYKPLYILMAVNMLIAVAFLYLTGVKVAGLKGGAMILAFCVGNPLYYLMPFWAYTNTFSISFTAGVVYFAVRLFEEKDWKDRVISSIMLGFCAIAGYYIRATVMIPMIAFVLCFLVELIAKRKRFLHTVQSLIVTVLVSVILMTGISSWNQSYFPNVSDQNIPVTHWLMMAAHGNGEHSSKDYAYTKQFETKEEKQKATLQKIKEYYKGYTPVGFLKFLHKKLKTSWCYAETGDLRSKIYQDRKNTWLYPWILGDKADLFHAYCYAFRLANLVLIFIGFFTILRKKRIEVYPIFVAVSFLGGICFYSIWEVKSSYGVPFVMFLLLLGVYGTQCLVTEEEKRKTVSKRSLFTWKKLILFAMFSGCTIICVKQMNQAKINYKQWTVHCAGGSTKNHMTYQDNMYVEQTFSASKPFNQIGVDVRKEKNSQDSLMFTLSDESGQVIYHTEIEPEQNNKDKLLYVKFPTIEPEHRNTKYKLAIYSEKPLKGKITIGRRREYYMGGYNGVLTVNGERQTEELYMQVLQKTEQSWCSRRAAIMIAGMICGVAGIMILIWPAGKRKQ